VIKVGRGEANEGLLFFFGRDDEEQLWEDKRPQDDALIFARF
jgi:hypothetical protein